MDKPIFVIAEDGTAFDLRKVTAVYNHSTASMKVALEGAFTVIVQRHSYAEAALRDWIGANPYVFTHQRQQPHNSSELGQDRRPQ